MRTISKSTRPAFAAAAALLTLVSFCPENARAQEFEHNSRAVIFSGADWAQDSMSFYSGGIVSLQGNLDRDGFVARYLAIYGDFDSESGVVPGLAIDGDVVGADVLLGYQFTRGVITTTIYGGLDYKDYDLSPDDPTSETRGDEFGFKVALDFSTSYDLPYYVSGSGSYSTAFDSYYALLRVGYNSQRFAFGPEGLVGGDISGDIQRLGGFVTLRSELTPYNSGELTANAGYQFADDGGATSAGGEGAYGGVSFSLSF